MTDYKIQLLQTVMYQYKKNEKYRKGYLYGFNEDLDVACIIDDKTENKVFVMTSSVVVKVDNKKHALDKILEEMK